MLALSLLLVAGCTAPTRAADPNADPAGFLGGTSLSRPYQMPDLTLTDTAGRAYNVSTSPSKPVTLMFFGYTNCPDVCIAVLADVAKTLQGVDPGVRDQIQLVFVTTDPGRDTTMPIREYLDRFDASFIGLTGSLSTIKTLAHQVGVDVEGMKKLPSGGYEVGHSAQVIGFDHTRGVVIWTPNTSIGDLEHDFTLLVDQSQ